MPLTRSKRTVLTLYGVASAFIFIWVPWRGYEAPIYQVPKDRWNSMLLGYGPIWSQVKPPANFVTYSLEDAKYSEDYARYQRSHQWDCVGPTVITKEDAALGFKPDPPPPGYCIVQPPGFAASPPPPKKPEVPEGYISPGIYRWARLDYERVLLEFGALTGLLLVAWMFTYTRGKSNEPK